MSILFSNFLQKINEVRPQEANFTEVLESIAVMPKMLYLYGKIPEKRVKTVAIVGTRKSTKYGSEIAYRLAYEVAKRGAIVVSGLAYGIDSVAHRGALDAGGITVAVLGTPIDKIYPRAHLGLAEKIVETGGVVMSELAPGAKFYPKVSFLERNRLISGLADVVVIPEAAERSGSLNTAAHALEQGREVFAAPGDITRPMSRGCNRLIMQGATPYLGVDDVINFLFPPTRKSRRQATLLFGDTEEETRILRLVEAGCTDGEVLINELAWSAAEFNRTVMMLEIKGRLKAMGCNQWCLG